MVTAYFTSPINNLSHLFQTQSNLFVPTLTDLTVYTIFEKKVNNFRVSHVAGALAGTAAYCLLVHRTSLSVNLAGAVLYMIYKISYFVQEYMVKKSFEEMDTEIPLIEEDLEVRFSQFEQELQIKSSKVKDPSYDAATLALQLKTYAQDLWKKPTLIQEAEKLMHQAHGIIIDKLQEAENEAGKNADPSVLNQEIAQNLDEHFRSALTIFCKTYFYARTMTYTIDSSDEGYFAVPDQSENAPNPFDGKVSNSHIRMMDCYQSVYKSLGPLWPYLDDSIKELFIIDVNATDASAPD